MNLEIIGQCGIGKTFLCAKIINEKNFEIINPTRVKILIFKILYVYKICSQNKFNIFNLFRRDVRFLINNISYRYLLIDLNKHLINKGYFIDRNILQIFVTFKTIFDTKNNNNFIFSKFIIKEYELPNKIIFLKTKDSYKIYNRFISREKKLNRIKFWGNFSNLKNRYSDSINTINELINFCKINNVEHVVYENYKDDLSNRLIEEISDLLQKSDNSKNIIEIDKNENNIEVDSLDIQILNNHKIFYNFNKNSKYLKVFKFKNIINFIIGMPLINNIVSFDKINEILNKNELIDREIYQLNGEFLLISMNLKNLSLRIINDRFASYPIYYSRIRNNFFCNLNYIEIVKNIKKIDKININKSSIYEFLWFRKVHGSNTYHKEISFLNSASILEISTKDFNHKKYWYPNFQKNKFSLNKNSLRLNELVQNSIKLKTQDFDKNKIGLFLSGGMDTRFLLSSLVNLNIKPTCYTVGYSELGEYKTASTITNISNLKHYFLQLPINEYDIFWKKKLYLSSAFHVPYHNIFMGFNHHVSKQSDIILHGHGLDFLFQGMYLPLEHLNILGIKTYYNYFHNLNKKINLIDFYMDNIGYRNWRVNLQSLSNKKNTIKNTIKENLLPIYENSLKLTDNNYDIWEYFMIENISRHYSQTDVLGISTNSFSSKVTNENNLFDFYLSLDKNQRKDGSIEKKSLTIANPLLAKMKSANTNFKVTASPTELNIYFAYIKLMRTITRNQEFRHPNPDDRTWPDHDLEIIRRKNLNFAINNLKKSDKLFEILDLFDRKKLINFIDLCINSEFQGGGQFLMALLTIDQFLDEIS